MALKYEAKCKSGTYTNRNGEEKTNWVKIGAVFETNNGLSMKIDSIPVVWDGWVSFFEPKPKEEAASKPASNSIEDDAVPF